jgi:PAS domain S-box-containing protein
LLQITLPQIEAIEDAETIAARIRQIISQGSIRFEGIHRRKDGSTYQVEVSVTYLPIEGGRLFTFVRDITERKRAEAELRESESRFRSYFDLPLAGRSITSLTKGWLQVNATLCEMLGYTENELKQLTWNEVTHPDDLAADVVQFNRVLAGEINGYAIEKRFVRKNGRIIHTDLAVHCMRRPDGTVDYFVALLHDITERKHAESRILRLNRLYAVLSQINQTIVRVRDTQTLFQEICRIIIEYGKFRMAWIGWVDEASQSVKPIAFAGEEQGYLMNGLITYQDEPSERDPVSTAIREGRCVICQDIANNPIMIPWRTSALARGYRASAAVPIRQHDCVVGVLIVYAAEPDGFDVEDENLLNEITSDIAFALETMQVEKQRKLAEDQLRESESRYRLISENSADVIWVMDPLAGKFTYVSPSVQKLRGYSPAEILAQPIAESLTPESLRLVTAAIASRLPAFMAKGTGTESFSDQVDQPRRDGSIVPTEVTTTYLFNERGEVEIIGVSRDITERKQRERELGAMATMTAALRSARTRSEMLPIITNQISNLVNAASVALLFNDEQTNDYVIEYAQGMWTLDIGKHLPRTAGILRNILEQSKSYFTNDLPNDLDLFYHDSIQGLSALIEIPMVTHEATIGILAVASHQVFNNQDIRVLTAISDIAANAIHRAALHERTEKYAADLRHAYNTTLEGWAHALELRDQETEGHTRRVVELTIELARAMGLAENEMEPIQRGALLHDIGKMGIPDSVLLKPGTLNDREWEIMRQHPEYAYKLLLPIDYLHSAIDIPYCHHEKWDGTGYPRRLKGQAIPLAARIFAVVDVWDALCSDRPYRLAWSKEQARKYLQTERGKHFDPAIVDVFLEMITAS